MKVRENNIDAYFKTGVENASLSFDTNKGWRKLEKKRSRNIHKLVAMVAIVICLVSVTISLNLKPKISTPITNESLKRQKLKEYEEILSGNYIPPLICYDCNNEWLNPSDRKTSDVRWVIDSY